MKLTQAEPVAIKLGVAAILSVLVASGVINIGVSNGIDAAILAVVNVVMIIWARASVVPVAKLIDGIPPVIEVVPPPTDPVDPGAAK